MGVTRFATRWGALMLVRRAAVSVPYVGALVAVVLLGSAIRRKGALGGTVDTGLNAIPYLGALKNALELLLGDLVPDRPAPPSSPSPDDILGPLELRPDDRRGAPVSPPSDPVRRR